MCDGSKATIPSRGARDHPALADEQPSDYTAHERREFLLAARALQTADAKWNNPHATLSGFLMNVPLEYPVASGKFNIEYRLTDVRATIAVASLIEPTTAGAKRNCL